jgi:hypothetical protein
MSIAIAAGEQNTRFIMVGNISTAYLGSELGPLAGPNLTIVRALHGLWAYGSRWYHFFAYVMQLMGFSPFKVDPDLWIHDCITYNEHVLVYKNFNINIAWFILLH